MTSLTAAVLTVSLLGPHVSAAPQAKPAPRSILAAALAQKPALQRPSPYPVRSPGRQSPRARAIIIGVLAGAAAGGGLGYLATKDCGCDSPGYGAILGFPIGAIVGGVVGAKLK